MADETRHTISESADKIVVNTVVKRGENTRDEDKLKLRVKGNDAESVAERTAATLDALREEGVAAELRATQPGGGR